MSAADTATIDAQIRHPVDRRLPGEHPEPDARRPGPGARGPGGRHPAGRRHRDPAAGRDAPSRPGRPPSSTPSIPHWGAPVAERPDPTGPTGRRPSAWRTPPCASAAATSGPTSTWPSTPGTFVAVLGPNGSGKSTLIKAVLGRACRWPTGRVEVLRAARRATAGGDIGYLPQRRSFDPGMRVRGVDVVRLGVDGDRWGLPLPWGARPPGPGRPGRRGRSTWWGPAPTPAGRSARCRVASSSACSSPRRWCASPACCCSTSPSTAWTCPTRPPWPR